MSHPFAARYDGRCWSCEERIYEGDMIRFADDGVTVHADCSTAVPTAAAQPMCPDCFTELPLTGVCGNCT